MTYEQYWEQDCTLVRHYRKASEIKQDVDNQRRWLQGLYFYEALCCVAPVLNAFAKKGTKPVPYRAEPYPLRNEVSEARRNNEPDQNDLKAKAVMEMYMIHNNKKFKPNGGEGNG